MARTYLDAGRPVAALATQPGRSALAVIRTSGAGAVSLCSGCFSPRQALLDAQGYTMVHGYIVDPSSGERIDEVVAAVYRGPRSFTGEDSVEFSCHGSTAVTRRVLAALEAVGFSPALPGEFSFRAFINGKADLVQAEAINELSGAHCESAREDALLRLGGALSAEFSALRDAMLDLLAEIEARLDYPAEEGPDEKGPDGEGSEAAVDRGNPWLSRLVSCESRLVRLLGSFVGGRLRAEGALVVVAGRPNAGKSSLFNLIVREERAIVSPEPGTTRDWLESWIEIAGYALRLVDTAGLRKAEAEIEAEGVRRSLDMSGKADIVVYLVDGRLGLGAEDEDFLTRHPQALRLWNKIDAADCKPIPPGWLGLSAKKGLHLDALEAAITRILRASSAVDGEPARKEAAGRKEEAVRVASARQKALLDLCLGSVRRARAGADSGATLDAVSLDIREAADFLGEITGEIAGEEVFNRIFGSFCLGK